MNRRRVGAAASMPVFEPAPAANPCADDLRIRAGRRHRTTVSPDSRTGTASVQCGPPTAGPARGAAMVAPAPPAGRILMRRSGVEWRNKFRPTMLDQPVKSAGRLPGAAHRPEVPPGGRPRGSARPARGAGVPRSPPGRAPPSTRSFGDEGERLEPAEYHGAGNGGSGPNPAPRRSRYGRPVLTRERTLPLATPVDASLRRPRPRSCPGPGSSRGQALTGNCSYFSVMLRSRPRPGSWR